MRGDRLSCSVTEEASTHTVSATCEVNGGALQMGPVPFFTKARQTAPYDYVESCRVKFQPRHGTGYEAQYRGFFFDDLEYSKNGEEVMIGFEPEFHQVGASCPGASCANDPDSTLFDLRCRESGWFGPLCPEQSEERAMAINLFEQQKTVMDLSADVQKIKAEFKALEPSGTPYV